MLTKIHLSNCSNSIKCSLRYIYQIAQIALSAHATASLTGNQFIVLSLKVYKAGDPNAVLDLGSPTEPARLSSPKASQAALGRRWGGILTHSHPNQIMGELEGPPGIKEFFFWPQNFFKLGLSRGKLAMGARGWSWQDDHLLRAVRVCFSPPLGGQTEPIATARYTPLGMA